MRNSIATTLALSCGLSGWIMSAPTVGDHGLEVRDSKGRVRMATKESDDGTFSLGFVDTKGNTRLHLQLDGVGRPSIAMSDEKGGRCVEIGQATNGTWITAVQHEHGLAVTLSSGPEGLTGLVVRNPDGTPVGWLASSAKSERTEVGVTDMGSPDMRKAAKLVANKMARGLFVGDGVGDHAGLAMTNKEGTGFLWIGDDPTQGRDTSKKEGLLGMRGPSGDVFLSLRPGSGSEHVLLASTKADGVGLNMGTELGPRLRMRLESGKGLDVSLKDAEGKELVHLPTAAK